MEAGEDSEGNIIVNPFYKRSRDEIIKNLDYAKEVYISVFRIFKTTWFYLYLKGINKLELPLEWETLEI